MSDAPTKTIIYNRIKIIINNPKCLDANKIIQDRTGIYTNHKSEEHDYYTLKTQYRNDVGFYVHVNLFIHGSETMTTNSYLSDNTILDRRYNQTW